MMLIDTCTLSLSLSLFSLVRFYVFLVFRFSFFVLLARQEVLVRFRSNQLNSSVWLPEICQFAFFLGGLWECIIISSSSNSSKRNDPQVKILPCFLPSFRLQCGTGVCVGGGMDEPKTKQSKSKK
ncbi:unnamed protein product [Laminaria digitata]